MGGFVLFDSVTKKYYAKSNWVSDLRHAYVFDSIELIKKKCKFFKYHPDYLERNDVHINSLEYVKVLIKLGVSSNIEV